MKPHLWQSDQWSAGTAEGDRGNLPVACGDGLVEASLSLKTTPDWTDYLFCSGQPAKERVTGVVPCMLVPGWRDESPLPRPSHGCEVRSREILLPCLSSALLCFVLPRVGEIPPRVSEAPAAPQPWAQILALPLPAARAEMRTSCQKLQK